MKLLKKDFNPNYYKLWEMGLQIPEPKYTTIYNLKFSFKGQNPENYDRVCLRATSISDAIERACYSTTHTSCFKPEDVNLHAVYDEEDNLLWIDEPFYNLVQKKYEFRGMSRRELLAHFGTTSAALLYGIIPSIASAGGLLPIAFIKNNPPPKGQTIFTSTTNWTVPVGVKNVSFVIISGGTGGGYGAGAGGGGAFYNNVSVTPGSTNTVTIGAGSIGATYSPLGATASSGGSSSFLGYSPTGPTFVGAGSGGTQDNGSNGAAGTSNANGTYPSGGGGQGGGFFVWGGTPGGAGGGGGLSIYGGAGGAGGSAGGTGGGIGGAGGVICTGGTGSPGGNGGNNGGNGGIYGGGGGQYGTNGQGGGGVGTSKGGDGGSGVVRVIWGSGRTFPYNAV
jgi:hypothetical protein